MRDEQEIVGATFLAHPVGYLITEVLFSSMS